MTLLGAGAFALVGFLLALVGLGLCMGEDDVDGLWGWMATVVGTAMVAAVLC